MNSLFIDVPFWLLISVVDVDVAAVACIADIGPFSRLAKILSNIKYININ